MACDGVLAMVSSAFIALLREYGVADERGRLRASKCRRYSPFPHASDRSFRLGKAVLSGQLASSTGYPRSHELAALHIMDERRRTQTPYC